MIIKKFKSWLSSYRSMDYYCTTERTPFYEIAGKYIPPDNNVKIIDIGPGRGEFGLYLSTLKDFENIYLLEGNPATVDKLKKNFEKVVLYRAPERLPFDDRSVGFIHCSHLIEHFYYNDLYEFLKEIDRVLTPNGILVISAPVLWERFYDDLSHVKPYNPETITSYFCGGEKNRSAKPVSERYTVLELIYRYYTKRIGEGWGSESAVFDILVRSAIKLLNKIGVKEFVKNGYTLVLKKQVD